MANKTLFEKIIDREIPADIVHEDERCIAFRDINPQAPVHVLVCPRKPLAKVAEGTVEDAELLGHLLLTAAGVAEREGCGDGFRLVVNNGEAAGQTVFHLHVHVLGGRSLGWPPG
ncbi:MAG: histidine triad nucleotide-binding protein [Gammaproteobacteria bacterium]|jgi:histidine triad (HIT) family protein